MRERFKTILDEECFGNIAINLCPQKDAFLDRGGHQSAICWMCHKNDSLVDKLMNQLPDQGERIEIH